MEMVKKRNSNLVGFLGVYGIPQVSVLGSLLILLYINDIKAVSEKSYCHLHADDTILIQSISDPDSLIKSLERELSNAHFLWFGNEPCLKKQFCCLDTA